MDPSLASYGTHLSAQRMASDRPVSTTVDFAIVASHVSLVRNLLTESRPFSRVAGSLSLRTFTHQGLASTIATSLTPQVMVAPGCDFDAYLAVNRSVRTRIYGSCTYAATTTSWS